jgi:acyl carrier protein
MTATRLELVFSEVTETVATIAGVPMDQITGETELIRDLNLDSLAMYEIVIDLEEAFGLRISDTDLDKIRTVNDAVHYILAASPAE